MSLPPRTSPPEPPRTRPELPRPPPRSALAPPVPPLRSQPAARAGKLQAASAAHNTAITCMRFGIFTLAILESVPIVTRFLVRVRDFLCIIFLRDRLFLLLRRQVWRRDAQ